MGTRGHLAHLLCRNEQARPGPPRRRHHLCLGPANPQWHTAPMSKLEAIEAEVRKLPPEQAIQLQDWLAIYPEDEAELNPEFVPSIERGQADLREGRVRVRKT